MFDFKGKVALVTGGSRGIGRAISVGLGRGGATVVVNYAGNEAAAQETCKLIEAAGGKAIPKRFDVADSAACSAAIDETVKEHVQHILKKLGVSDRTQAAVWAVRRDLV